jgi:hypothetical protein
MDLDKLESYDLEDADKELIKEKVTKAKFRLLKSFGQRHNIVVHIRKLSARTNHFRKLIEKIILIDNRTRWNS